MDKTLKYLSFVVFFFAVICFAVVPNILRLMETTSKNNKICLPAANGRIQCGANLYDLRDYLNNSIANTYVKVMKEDRDHQQKYLEDNKVRLMSVSDQFFWEAKPSASLKGKEQPDTITDIKVAEMTAITEWMYDKNPLSTSSFLRNGVRYRKGRLVVPVDGTYYLYSFIDLFEPCDQSTGKPNIEDLRKPIKHALFKFNIDTAESEITSNIQPHHISKNKFYNSYSSYVSIIVSLKAGDEISVKVSYIRYLKYTKDNSFGLYLI
ncbi:uncharacterized protein LOC132749400 [Ruditapes philippinarum]|uniref:uncharacterized protein LOC132749400 n=1 Tax=Ruditapes philippinarum TaxID=129788 RepID=UPI00295AE5C5|nr:uncharacterized protein LOC132749400 [Ruditapes philippinarum]